MSSTVLITGGAGFLGQRLARALLKRGVLKDRDGREQTFDRLVLVDIVEARGLSDPRLETVVGDISDPALINRVIDETTTSIFHLAAIVSGMAEADFDIGMRINLDASRLILERCRALGHIPKLVFASSVAVYGGALPELVLETSALRPQSSYGTQKAIVELLTSDYSRRGFVDGRAVRLPTICVRPGKPNAAASSFASGIIREPLSGQPSNCPVDPSTKLWLLSPSRAIDCLMASHDLPADALGSVRTVNLPGLSIRVSEMVAALERVAGPEVVAQISWQRDPKIERLVETWPGTLDDTRARALGLPSDDNFDDIVRAHIRDELGGEKS